MVGHDAALESWAAGLHLHLHLEALGNPRHPGEGLLYCAIFCGTLVAPRPSVLRDWFFEPADEQAEKPRNSRPMRANMPWVSAMEGRRFPDSAAGDDDSHMQARLWDVKLARGYRTPE